MASTFTIIAALAHAGLGVASIIGGQIGDAATSFSFAGLFAFVSVLFDKRAE